MKLTLVAVVAAAAVVVGARGADDVALPEEATEDQGRALLLRGDADAADDADEAGARELTSLSGGDTPPGTMEFVRIGDGSVMVNWTVPSQVSWMSVGLGTQMTGAFAVIGGKGPKPTSCRITGQTSTSFVPEFPTIKLSAMLFSKTASTTLKFKSKGIGKTKYSVDGASDSIVWAFGNSAWPSSHDGRGVASLQLPVHCPGLTVLQCYESAFCKVTKKKCVRTTTAKPSIAPTKSPTSAKPSTAPTKSPTLPG
jgi:hypothetical protein